MFTSEKDTIGLRNQWRMSGLVVVVMAGTMLLRGAHAVSAHGHNAETPKIKMPVCGDHTDLTHRPDKQGGCSTLIADEVRFFYF